jgi:hypothetical protein
MSGAESKGRGGAQHHLTLRSANIIRGRNLMSYLIELQTPAGIPGYVIADGANREEALAHAHEQLGMDYEDEIVVLAVHTVH